MDALSGEVWLAIAVVAAVAVLSMLHICAVMLREVDRVETFKRRVADLRAEYKRKMEELAVRRGAHAAPEEVGEVDVIENPPAEHRHAA